MSTNGACPNCHSSNYRQNPRTYVGNECLTCGYTGPVADFHKPAPPPGSIIPRMGDKRERYTGRELENGVPAVRRDRMYWLD